MLVNYRHIEDKKWEVSTTPNDAKQIYFRRISKPIQRLLLTLKTLDDSDETELLKVEKKARREMGRIIMVLSTTNVYVERKLGRIKTNKTLSPSAARSIKGERKLLC